MFFELLEEGCIVSRDQWLSDPVARLRSSVHWTANNAFYAFQFYICIQGYLENRLIEHLWKLEGAAGRPLQGNNPAAHGSLWRLPVSIDLLGSRTRLDLSLCSELEEVPDSFLSQLIHLTSLNLSHCTKLRKLPDSIGQLEGMASLNLSHCKELRMLPGTITQLARLSSLDLSDCVLLPRLPFAIGQLGGLVHLDLTNCRQVQSSQSGSQLPTSFSQLTNLTSLSLSGCEQLQVPLCINNFPNLARLSLPAACWPVKQLPPLNQLTNLTSLSFSGSERLEQLPPSIRQLCNLASLDLSGCSKLQELPPFIGQLTTLTSLGLSRCAELQQLPASIGQLSYLASLNLSGCKQLQQLPASIGQLSYLASLGLSHCKQLLRLPDLSGCVQLSYTDTSSLDTTGCEHLIPTPLGRLPPQVQDLYPGWMLDLLETLAQALAAISWIAILLATASFVGFVTAPGGPINSGLVQLAVVPASPSPPSASSAADELRMNYDFLRAYFICNLVTFFFAISTNLFVVTHNMPDATQLTTKDLVRTIIVANLLLALTVLAGVATFVSGAFSVYPRKNYAELWVAMIPLAMVFSYFMFMYLYRALSLFISFSAKSSQLPNIEVR